MTLEENLSNHIIDISKTVVFVGAGFSISAGFPSWTVGMNEILEEYNKIKQDEISYKFLKQRIEENEYLLVMENVHKLLGSAYYLNILQKVFDKKFELKDEHLQLVQIPFAGFITTNFDQVIETAYTKIFDQQLFIQSYDRDGVKRLQSNSKKYLFKLHGDINHIDQIVLRDYQYQEILGRSDIRELIRSYMINHQFLFIGYGLRDPDFVNTWKIINTESRLSAPGLILTQKGNYSRDEINSLKNDQLLVFQPEQYDESYNFLKTTIKYLAAKSIPSSTVEIIQREEMQTEKTDLEMGLMLVEVFDNARRDTLNAFIKSISLNYILRSTAEEISKYELLHTIEKTLSLKIEESDFKVLLNELEKSNYIILRKEKLTIVKKQTTSLNKKVDEFQNRLNKTIVLALERAAAKIKISLTKEDAVTFKELVIKVFAELGKDLSQKVLFYRNLDSDIDQIGKCVKEFVEKKSIAMKEDLYFKSIMELFCGRSTEEEEVIFKLIQMYFITSSYVLNPKSEKLLKEYVSKYVTYFDSNIILQAMAEGHYNYEVSIKVIEKTRGLGVQIKLLKEIFDEVIWHTSSAIRHFEELEETGLNLIDALEAHIELVGQRNCNVFLYGYYKTLQGPNKYAWREYMLSYCESVGKLINVSEKKIREFLEINYDIIIYNVDYEKNHQTKISTLFKEVISLRKFGHRFINEKLCYNEAKQFYVIYQERLDDLIDKVWFITNDTFITRLYEEFRDTYMLPSSYSPLKWYQYLQLVDYDSRASKHFSRLFNFSELGAIDENLAITTIKLIAKREENLIKKGVFSVSQFAYDLVHKHHIKNVYQDYHSQQSKNSIPEAEGRNNVKKMIGEKIEATLQEYVALKKSDFDKLEQSKDDLAKTQKKLKQEQFKKKQIKAQLLKATTKKR
ncbi:MAG: SIR2 family protein [Ignavibacteriaceae bacterium]|jgi:hypothetical protein